MKTKMKISICALLTICAINVNGQKNLQWGKKLKGEQKTGIYKTIDDFKNDKIEDVGKITSAGIDYFMIGKKFTMFKKVDFVGFKDEWGNRHRIINGKAYIVLSYGKINLYSKRYGFNTIDSDGNIERNAIGYDDSELFYSLSDNDEPIKLKGWDSRHNEKMGELLFKDNEAVKTAYVNDDSEDYDYSVKKAYTDNLERIIHYVDIYNGLIK